MSDWKVKPEKNPASISIYSEIFHNLILSLRNPEKDTRKWEEEKESIISEGEKHHYEAETTYR